MPHFSINFEVYCKTCGQGMCEHVEVENNPFGKPRIMIPVCNRCVESERALLMDRLANPEAFEDIKTKQ